MDADEVFEESGGEEQAQAQAQTLGLVRQRVRVPDANEGSFKGKGGEEGGTPNAFLRGKAADYPVGKSERWIADHLLRWIPGSGHADAARNRKSQD